MKNYSVVYYSKNGSNMFLAEKTARILDCDLIELRPRLSAFFSLMMASMTGLSFGNYRLNPKTELKRKVILCGPIWMGKFISPLKDFVRKYGKNLDELHFITCCGSTDKMKDDRFGYAGVFEQVRQASRGKLISTEAFPIELVLPEEKKNDDSAMMNTRLNNSNFSGEISRRYDRFLGALSK